MSRAVLQVAVIAPEPVLGALTVLIQSAANLAVMAAAATLETLLASCSGIHPDLVMIYLAQESEANRGAATIGKIQALKLVWPDVPRIAIVRYASQQDQALQAGAELTLFEGVSAGKLLAAIEEKFG